MIKRILIGLVLSATFQTSAVFSGSATIYHPNNVTIVSGAVEAGRSGEIVFRGDFTDASSWRVNNYRELLNLEFGRIVQDRPCLYVTREVPYEEVEDSPHDVAWQIASELKPLEPKNRGRECLLRVETIGDKSYRGSSEDGKSWRGGVNWYDASRELIGTSEALFYAEPQEIEKVYALESPENAAFFEVCIGVDAPNIELEGFAAVLSASLEVIDPSAPYSKPGEFESDIYECGSFSWRCETPGGSALRFQIATSSRDERGDLSFSPFAGPDGAETSYYDEPFEVEGEFMRYKAILIPSATASPRLLETRIGSRAETQWRDSGDVDAPVVRIIAERSAPTQDALTPVTLEISDDSLILAASLRFAIDDVDATERAELTWRDARTVVASVKLPEPLEPGLHAATVEASDFHNNRVVATRAFLVGDAPQTPKISLRDDGMTLIDGVPFFPIGLYGVTKREFNGNDIDEAFRGLQEAGFNFAHSYSMPREDEFLRAAEKYNFKLWSVARFPDERFVQVERNSPAIIAWYLGDDTSANTSVSELYDYHYSVKAVDPTRLTVQADPIGSDKEVSNYRPYVKGTDAFLPEIYPVHEEGEASGLQCVAQTIRDVQRARSDALEAQDGPKAIWPIIQYFQGWGWRRFPTYEELRAMSFAALAARANGITWYTYGGFVNPEKKMFNYGVTTTPERWRNISTVATQINDLSPVLLEETREEWQPRVEILSGATTNPLGEDAIVFLLKRHEGAFYLIAVNSVHEEISVRFHLSQTPKSEKPVLMFDEREKTSASFESNALTDVLEPFAVRVYRWE